MLPELKARPLAILLAGLLIGLSFSSISWIFSIGIGLGWIFRKGWLAVFCGGAYLAGFLLVWHSPPPALSAGPIHEKVVIRSFPSFMKGKSLYSFETIGPHVRTGILRVDPELSLSPFSVVDVEGVAGQTKTGSFTPDRVAVVSRIGLFDALTHAQTWAIDRTIQLYGRDDGAWVSALTFNFPSDLSPEEKSDLRFNGTYHLVSASGMHVWVIAFMLHWLMTLARVPRHWQLGSIFLFLLVYCSVTGFHAPTLRASLMWLIGSAAYLFRRSPDGLSALCLSALIWLFFVPSDAFTAGFQLSYIVSGCLLLWFERKRMDDQKTAKTGFEAAIVATIASEPLSAWWFGRIIFIGPISNILIEIPSCAVMVLGFLSLVPGAGYVMPYMAKPLLWWMKWVTGLTAQFPCLLVRRYTLPPWIYVLYYCLLLVLLLGRRASVGDPLKKI